LRSLKGAVAGATDLSGLHLVSLPGGLATAPPSNLPDP
jgi:hypothetical protein